MSYETIDLSYGHLDILSKATALNRSNNCISMSITTRSRGGF